VRTLEWSQDELADAMNSTIGELRELTEELVAIQKNAYEKATKVQDDVEYLFDFRLELRRRIDGLTYWDDEEFDRMMEEVRK
jgi:hypothetical protein